MHIYGRNGHEEDQMYFSYDGQMLHRNCFYGTNSWNGWRYMLDSSNYSGYAVPISGGINMTGSFGLNDNRLYLRTNGDTNHFLWNADDDWEEMRYYTGTGFRVQGSTGTVSATFTNSGINSVNMTINGAQVWYNSGGWMADFASYGFTRYWGIAVSGGEFVTLYASGQVSTLIDGSYFAGENNGFFSLNGSNQYTSRVGFSNSGGGVANFNAPIRINTNNNLYLDYNYGQSVVGVYTSVRFQGVFAMGDAYKLAIDGTNPGSLYGIAWSHPNAGGQASYLNDHGMLVMNYGTTFAAISSRAWFKEYVDATYYRDRESTGFYCDPASESRLNGIRVYPGLGTGRGSYSQPLANIILEATSASPSGYCSIEFLSNYNTPSDGAAITYFTGTDGGEASQLRIRLNNDYNDGIRLMGGYIRFDCETVDGASQGYQNNIFSWWRYGTQMMYLDSGNTLWNAGAVYGSIFRDSENGGRYMDPSGQSYIYNLCVGENNYSHAYPGVLQLGSTSYNYNFNNGSWAGAITAGILANCADEWEFTIHDSGTSVESVFIYSGGRLLMGRNIGWGTTYIEAAESFRAPIFYDSNNTAYYTDPTGYSQMSSGEFNNYCRAARFTFIGTGGDSGQYGAPAYEIFQEGGGWGYPYPDLRIAYHTGIKMGANAGSYEGIRIYDDYPMSSILIQLTGSSNYSFWYTWQNLTGYHGIYSGLNSAHIYPNNGSYGSWRIDGSRNGWPGIEFGSVSNGPVSLMCYSNGNETGWHNNSYSWQTYWYSGTLRIAKNTYGGNLAIALDSSNANAAYNLNQGVNTNSEPRFRSNYFYHGTTSRHTGLALYSSYTMGVWEVRTDFEGISGGESAGIGQNGDFTQFWNPGDIGQAFMFSDEDGGTGGYIAYLSNGGTFVNSDRRIKYSIREKVSENYEYLDRFMQLKPVSFAFKYEFKEDDTPKARARKIAKMLDVHQGLIAQDVLEVFPTAINHSQDVRKLNFELNDETFEILSSVGIDSPDEIEEVKQHYIEKGKQFDFDMYSINWSTMNTYQILALQDFKKMYDAKCEEIEVLKSDLALIKAQLGIS
jgi:hypothetical protein